MSVTAKTRWTLVQHSGAAMDPGFEHGVEEAVVTTRRQAEAILRAGGLLFYTYPDAADRAEAENFPPDLQGLYPCVPGTFVSRPSLDGRKLYIPKPDADADAEPCTCGQGSADADWPSDAHASCDCPCDTCANDSCRSCGTNHYTNPNCSECRDTLRAPRPTPPAAPVLLDHQHKQLLAIRDALAFRLDAGLDHDSRIPEAHYLAALRSTDALITRHLDSIPDALRCPDCCGTGILDTDSQWPCGSCHGTGSTPR